MDVLSVFSVALFGAFVGAVELMSRHRDHRFLAIATVPSFIYIVMNSLMSLSALFVIAHQRPVWLGYTWQDAPSDPTFVILTAGFGAAAFFRTSIFKLRVGDTDLSVGPAMVLELFLNVIDEAVDRSIGERRLVEIAALTEGLDFKRAANNLPPVCFAALSRLSADAQRGFGVELVALEEDRDASEQAKLMSLGLALMKCTGRPILQAGIRQLKNTIRTDVTP
jgi:hypothetical protein